MGVFDALVIKSTPNLEFVVITRPGGPIEPGKLFGNTWIPDASIVALDVPNGFGIDSSHNPYYDPDGAGVNERASLYLDPSTGQIWLELTT